MRTDPVERVDLTADAADRDVVIAMKEFAGGVLWKFRQRGGSNQAHMKV